MPIFILEDGNVYFKRCWVAKGIVEYNANSINAMYRIVNKYLIFIYYIKLKQQRITSNRSIQTEIDLRNRSLFFFSLFICQMSKCMENACQARYW